MTTSFPICFKISSFHKLVFLIVDHTTTMSKRLKKRQQREQEELEQLQAQQVATKSDTPASPVQEEAGDSDGDPSKGAKPVNPFAAVSGTSRS